MMPAPARWFRPLFVVLLLALAAAACYIEPVALTTFPPAEQPTNEQPTAGEPSGLPTVSPAATPGTVTPTATLPVTGVAADCVNGWAAAPEGSAEFGTAIYLVERQMEVIGPWAVDEVRYFTGPDVAWAEAPAPLVERWYVKAGRVDVNFRGRWLIERRSDLDFGVVAVAPYDTTGFQAPDWTGFVGDGTPTTYLGLPGQWTGTPYDFVSGNGYNYQQGLPPEVTGCLSGT